MLTTNNIMSVVQHYEQKGSKRLKYTGALYYKAFYCHNCCQEHACNRKYNLSVVQQHYKQ